MKSRSYLVMHNKNQLLNIAPELSLVFLTTESPMKDCSNIFDTVASKSVDSHCIYNKYNNNINNKYKYVI